MSLPSEADIAEPDIAEADILVTMSPDAVREAIRLSASIAETPTTREGQALRLYLDGKGCEGFSYGVSFDAPEPDDLRFPQEFEGRQILLVVDQDTAQFVRGSVITWVDDERGQGFLVDNPGHNKFRGKFFKRKSWKERAGITEP